jgi:hypothetical protein
LVYEKFFIKRIIQLLIKTKELSGRVHMNTEKEKILNKKVYSTNEYLCNTKEHDSIVITASIIKDVELNEDFLDVWVKLFPDACDSYFIEGYSVEGFSITSTDDFILELIQSGKIDSALEEIKEELAN